MAADKWSAAGIQRLLVRDFFKNAFAIVPNTNWTGFEADLLVVTSNLRLIDVEVKISRADLKADAGKDKWLFFKYMPGSGTGWPPRVWKHYYAFPAHLWHDDIMAGLPQASGVLLIGRSRWGGFGWDLKRRAVPNPKPYVLEPAQVLDVARLASVRMWQALEERDKAQGRYWPPFRPRVSVANPKKP